MSDLAHPATAIAPPSSFAARAIRLVVVLVSLLTIGMSILSRPDWKLRDFDQVFDEVFDAEVGHEEVAEGDHLTAGQHHVFGGGRAADC